MLLFHPWIPEVLDVPLYFPHGIGRRRFSPPGSRGFRQPARRRTSPPRLRDGRDRPGGFPPGSGGRPQDRDPPPPAPAPGRAPSLQVHGGADRVSLLARVSEALRAAGVPYALIGASAMTIDGVNRSTIEVDLFELDPACLDHRLWDSL